MLSLVSLAMVLSAVETQRSVIGAFRSVYGSSRVPFEIFVDLFVVNKRVHFVIVVCFVHTTGREEIFLTQMSSGLRRFLS